MSDERFKIYGTTSSGKMLISAEEVQAVISRELAVAGDKIEQLQKENAALKANNAINEIEKRLSKAERLLASLKRDFYR